MSKKKMNRFELVYREKWSSVVQIVAASESEALEEAEALRVHNLLKSKGDGEWTVAGVEFGVEEEAGNAQLEEHIAEVGSIGEQVDLLDRVIAGLQRKHGIAELQRIRDDLVEGRARGA